MEIFTYGITTSRYNSSILWNQNKLITAMGSNLGVWDIGSLTREKVLQYNSNVVMVLTQNSNYIFSIAYNGEVCVIDKISLDLVLRTKVEGSCVRHASVTDEYLIVNAERDPEKCKGQLSVLSLKGLETDKTLETVFALKGRYKYSHVLKNGKLFVNKENVLNEEERQVWRVLKQSDPTVKKESKPKKKSHYTMILFDIATKTELHSQSLEHFSCIISSQSNNEDLIDMLFLDRTLVCVNPTNFEIILHTKIAGTGAILSTALIDRSTFFSPKPGVLVQIKLDAVKKFPELFEVDKQELDSTAVYKLPGSGVDSKIFAFLLQDPSTGIICFEDGINVIDLIKNKVRTVSCFNITCCGIALSSDGELVACGDFSGNVNLFSTQSNLSVEPLARTFIMESIRTLVFDSKNESVIVGTMTGRLMRWWIQDMMNEPRPIATFTNSVLNVRYNYHHDGNRYLIAGLSNGMFAIFKEVELEHNMHYILGHYGHMPSTQPVDLDFGSLTHYAEIWSAVWSATSNNLFVTASEDQTCCVWDITHKNPNLIHKLTGHTKAVTSVDWRVMDDRLGELFISCSDDQTARVYDPKDSFKLLFTFSTSFINEWHTLTYLSLEEGGTRVAIGAQNGFLFIYDLLQKEFIFSERIHNGSVEGLDWRGNTVVTCSADNCISIVRVPKSTSMLTEK